MAIILDKYAIKEVADVMFYELDSKGAPSAPVLYLDTLKTSTISQSSETVDARGGKGNVKLLSWDTNKEITLELEDAVFSAKSLGIMFGGTVTQNGNTQEVLKTLKADQFESVAGEGASTGMLSFKIKDATYYIATNKVAWFKYVVDANTKETAIAPIASTTTMPTDADFGTFDLLDAVNAPTDGTGIVTDGLEINVTAEFGDNTYYITGDTYARNVASGKDDFLQFIIPKGKVSAEDVSLTMEADGDPAEFAMTVNCLKAENGSMIKLVKYNLGGDTAAGTNNNKGVASVLDYYNDSDEHRAPWTSPSARIAGASLNDNKGGQAIDISDYDG